MKSVVQKYFSVNPQTLNPFNAPHHNFIASDDADADADYLTRVATGETSRFYITLVERVGLAGHYNVTAYDGHNGNTLVSSPVIDRQPFASSDDRLLAALQAAIDAAARHVIDFRPDLAVVVSDKGHDHAKLLQRYAEGNDGDNASEWVSWTTQAALAEEVH